MSSEILASVILSQYTGVIYDKQQTNFAVELQRPAKNVYDNASRLPHLVSDY